MRNEAPDKELPHAVPFRYQMAIPDGRATLIAPYGLNCAFQSRFALALVSLMQPNTGGQDAATKLFQAAVELVLSRIKALVYHLVLPQEPVNLPQRSGVLDQRHCESFSSELFGSLRFLTFRPDFFLSRFFDVTFSSPSL